MAHRNAASVLPEPVGAITSVLLPSAMADQASACAGVGAAKVPVNHSRVAALKGVNGSGVELTCPSCQSGMTRIVLNTVTIVLVAALGVHALLKFVFFALPYRRRRAALDKSYRDKPSAATTTDTVVLVFTIAVA